MVFSAIAHPEEFVKALERKGVAIAATRAWRDHHRFTDADVETLSDMAAKCRAESFLTTQKDIVRLAERQRMRLGHVAPLFAVQLTVQLREPEAALIALEQRLLARGA